MANNDTIVTALHDGDKLLATITNSNNDAICNRINNASGAADVKINAVKATAESALAKAKNIVSGKEQISVKTQAANNNSKFPASTAFVKQATDGTFVHKHQLVINSACNEGTYYYDLKNYLPQDGRIYELYINAYMHDHSDDLKYVRIYTSLYGNSSTVSYCQLIVGDYADYSTNTFSLFAKANDKLTYTLTDAGDNNVDNLCIRLYGYRRVGTNT